MTEGSTGIIFDQDRRCILIVQRHDNGVWVLPGGGLDAGETPEQAVVREIAEETGLDVRVTKKVGEYSPINRLCSLAHVFECAIIDGVMQKSAETKNLGFYPLENLPYPFFPLHQDWIDDALLNDPVVLKKPIARLTYSEVAKYMIRHPLLVLKFFWTRLKMKFKTKS